MYVCMYICAHICIFVCMYVCMYVYMNDMCMYSCVVSPCHHGMARPQFADRGTVYLMECSFE